HNEDALTRVHAARALWEVQRQPGAVLPVLCIALTDDDAYRADAYVRIESSKALGAIGRERPDLVLPFLDNAYDDRDQDIAEAAGSALAVLGPKVDAAVAI